MIKYKIFYLFDPIMADDYCVEAENTRGAVNSFLVSRNLNKTVYAKLFRRGDGVKHIIVKGGKRKVGYNLYNK